ncbi:MAG: two-component system, cell cycle response regulator, partial [Actinomycetota bacterium]|nr:two-component system, cell cycle response regulator [Actinomycetota bacterium]
MRKSTKSRSTPLVLVVDDDPNLRMLAEMQLSVQGFDVVQASNGEEALAMARSKAPDVILLDMMMAGMDGADVLRALHADPLTEGIPVILLSALGGTEDRVKGLDDGAVDWITKPHEPRELIARVGAAARTKARGEEQMAKVGGDTVTKLPVRAEFDNRLRLEVSRSSRNALPFSVMLIDVDDMGSVNGRLGPTVGDELLRQIAGVVKSILRTSDELFRYGGDEFAVLLPDIAIGAAYLAAERCREEIATLQSAGVPTSVSIGVAQFSVGRTAEEIISRLEL